MEITIDNSSTNEKQNENVVFEVERIENFDANDKIEKLQTEVYNAGITVMQTIDIQNLITPDSGEVINKKYSESKNALEELKNFCFNVGFAGEQSSGKSTVINSLLQYPLMPTCNLVTTATVVKLIYGEKIKIIAIDDDTKERVAELDCENITEKIFNMLKQYAISAMNVLTVENLQYFTDENIFNGNFDEHTLDEMKRSNPKQVAMLALILLSVYVGQNDIQIDAQKEELMNYRKDCLKAIGISQNVYNMSVIVQWDNEILKKGFQITDLPGLGAAVTAQTIDGKHIKSHDEITIEAIYKTDAMVILADGNVTAAGFKALDKMLERLEQLKGISKESRIIPVLNNADRLQPAQLSTAKDAYSSILRQKGLNNITAENIRSYAAIYGDCKYTDIDLKPERMVSVLSNPAMQRMANYLTTEQVCNMMKVDYENAGIEQLKEFFRKKYIENGKYSKAISAVFTLNDLYGLNVTAKQLLIDNLESIKKANTEEAENVINDLKNLINDEISEQTTKIDAIYGNIVDEISKTKNESEKSVDKYIFAFETALAEYKKRNIYRYS